MVLNWGGFAPPAGDLWQRQSGLSLLGAATVIQWIEDAVQHLIISHTTENYPAPMSTVGFLGGAVVNGEGNGTPLQYSCLENPMDRGAWWATVHGVARRRTRLSDFTFTFQFPALEKEMATHSSVLAWRIPGTGKPGGLPSMGSHRVRHD